MDRLQCNDVPPEDYVEISFLRQTLENVMAAELSPHERDIVRLRLGLDDGQTRTVREVVEECGGGITVSDVRSAERRAFKKLRSPNALHAHNLVEYVDMLGVDIDNQR
jgi:DNA-directed RNA polymerase sigma subunit (sigma70/sigma32)